MSTIDLGDNPVGSTPTDAQKTQLRSSIGLGSADTVEFGAIVPPAGTTAEINTVSDATVGQVMINSETKQLVRFTSPSSYDYISNEVELHEDSLVESAPLTLDDSRFRESGLVLEEPDPVNFTNSVLIYDSTLLSNPAATTAVYYDGTGNFMAPTWLNIGNFSPLTSPIIAPNKMIRIQNGSNSTSFSYKKSVVSSTDLNELINLSLVADTLYKLELDVFFGDLDVGNLQLLFGYTGEYSNGNIKLKVNDLVNKNQVVFLQTELAANDTLSFKSNAKVGEDSPLLGSYSITMLIRPSSSGSFTLNARAIEASINPLLIGSAQTTVTRL